MSEQAQPTPDAAKVPAAVVVEAYRRRVSELQDELIMLQAYVGHLTSEQRDSGTSV